jgi:ORF19
MNKQELIKKYEDLFEKLYVFPIVTINGVIEDFKQLDEPQKVMIPRFIADWIVQAKEDGYNIAGAINEAPRGAVDDWLELENVDIFAEAWINGYTIEKEKRYTVKMKGMDKEFTMFKLDKIRGSWYLGNDTEYSYTKTTHTRKELEEAGFGEVFNSPLFEVEEVEE